MLGGQRGALLYLPPYSLLIYAFTISAIVLKPLNRMNLETRSKSGYEWDSQDLTNKLIPLLKFSLSLDKPPAHHAREDNRVDHTNIVHVTHFY
jgi:hypothetical protein